MGEVAANELCARCQAIDLGRYLTSPEGPGTINLGGFQDILKKNHCSLCRLVVQSLSVYASKYWKPGVYPTEVCYLGRNADYGDPNQPRLEVWFNATSDTLPAGSWGHHTTTGKIHLLDAAPTVVAGYTPSAQLVDEQVNASLVRDWMNACEGHSKCNTSRPVSAPSARDEVLQMPLLLVDVKRMRLAECDWDSRYLTLSYVWGRANQYLTLRSNYEQLREDGALQRIRKDLPRVINDAIDFVAALGESYLWVDTLCIIQDDEGSKKGYISGMDKIYGKSLLTLINMCGRDADAALPGVTSGSRGPAMAPVQIGPFKLLPGMPSLFAIEQLSTWDDRAWTFQEKILSKRRLYFSGAQVHWQCAESYRAESNSEEVRQGRISIGSFNVLGRDTKNDMREQFVVYRSLAQQYAPRKMTYASDALHAFTGVLSAVGAAFGWKFVSALPEPVFDKALLWRPMGSCTLKLRELELSSGQSRLQDRELPTWCWTTWSGYIYWDPWRLDWYAGKRIRTKSGVVDFFVSDDAGLRKVRREESLDGGAEEASGSLELPKNAPLNVLVFEAASLPTEVYTLSPPGAEPSWRLSRPASHSFKNSIRGQLWIFDASGHHCGMIKGLESWDPTPDGASYEFVRLSRNDQDEVTQADVDGSRDQLPAEYLSAEEYYAQVFDRSQFEYKRFWALNILLIKWTGDVAERVAIGLIHADAWVTARQLRKRIILG